MHSAPVGHEVSSPLAVPVVHQLEQRLPVKRLGRIVDAQRR
jgi:hypothetical protein